MPKIPVEVARTQLDELVRRAVHGREVIALTDGEATALLVSPRMMEDLEDSLAVAEYRRRKAEGTLGEGTPHEEVRRRLGLVR
ncbi:antitoxin (DNA-binding transcriptional repressor) of toxin-antitoxin stability system [Streptomyces sp. SAI-170]|uniref:type II toxin-antitoxin system prevent-host-death family antitoxin n=1 Tax=Streptomyces sp. SAI-170 TaxID=3377729 RepID=UPI003C7CD727